MNENSKDVNTSQTHVLEYDNAYISSVLHCDFIIICEQNAAVLFVQLKFQVNYSKEQKYPQDFIQAYKTFANSTTRNLYLAAYSNDRLTYKFKHFSPVLFPQPIPLDSTTLSGRPIIRGSLPSLVCRCCRPRICCCPSARVTYCWVSACFCTTAARWSKINANIP